MLSCIAPAVASPSNPPPTVSSLYPSVIGSVALIEVQGRAPAEDRPGTLTSTGALGSGVLISKEGHVLTAAHVVQTADEIRVHFSESVAVEATVVRSDPAADVALLQLAWVPQLAQVAPLGDSDRMEVGEQVFVVGAPLGLSHTLTVGHLSARRRPDSMITGLSNAELFQTDAAINQGNSGGPMFNMRGEVIGVVSHMVSVSGGFEGMGFAVTANATKELLIESKGFWSGLAGYRLSGKMGELLNVPGGVGILVELVAQGSPAEALGLRGGTVEAQIGGEMLVLGGDVILKVGEIPLSDPNAPTRVRAYLAELSAGQRVRLSVLREGRVIELEAAM